MADPQGIIARTVAALRYAATGNAPAAWFGPGNPLPDQAPPEVRGRQFDYPAFVNINYRPRNTEPVGFDKLKALADHCEPLKLVMGRQRDLAKALDWEIKPRKRAKGTSNDDPAIGQITDFLESPDGDHDWAQWLGAVLDQLFVLDAVSIYARPTLGGDVYALEVIDGATITPLVDQGGRRPMAPDAAYKQVLKGLPAASYTTDELTYFPENFRADHIYGWSRVEWIIQTAEMQIERLKSQKGYFTDGNVGDGYFTAPVGFTADQVALVERSWNAMMSADGGRRLAERRQAPFLPDGTEWHPTKVDLFQDMFDEWLMRLVCFPFGVSPTPFLKQQGLGHGSAKTDQAAAEESGLGSVMQYITRLMNRLIATRFERPDLEFAFDESREFDPEIAAGIQDKKLRNGSITLDEARDQDGKAPLPEGLGAKPLIYTAGGAVLLDSIINPPEPQEPIVPPGDPANDDQIDPAQRDETKPLAKAADNAAIVAAETKLNAVLVKFFASRAALAAASMNDALGLTKAAPIDDYGAAFDRAFDDVDWSWDDLVPLVEPLIASIAVASGTDALAELELFDKATLAKLMATTTAYAEARAAEMVGMRLVAGQLIENPDADWSIPEATRNMLRGEIVSALENGDSNEQLAKAIETSAAFSQDRAETVARTETATSSMQGAIAGWRASGLVAGRQFVAAPDCCPICQAQDGVIAALDEDMPGGDAPKHPKCRCSEVPVLPEDMPDGLGKAFDPNQPRDDDGRWADEIAAHVEEAMRDGTSHRQTVVGEVSSDNADFVAAQTGIDIAGFTRVVESSEIRHVFKSHGNAAREALRTPPQKAVTSEDIARIPEIVENATNVSKEGEFGTGKGLRLTHTADVGGHTYTYTEQVRPNKELVGLKTMRKR